MRKNYLGSNDNFREGFFEIFNCELETIGYQRIDEYVELLGKWIVGKENKDFIDEFKQSFEEKHWFLLDCL